MRVSPGTKSSASRELETFYYAFARGHAAIVLELAHTIPVTMMFGLRRTASRLGVRLAEPEKFHDVIANILHRTADSHT